MSLWDKIFKKDKEKIKGELAWLGCDMHNHVLPGIDDGAKTIADSLVLIQGLKDLGIDRCIATPHIISGLYDNTTEDIAQALCKIVKELDSRGIEFSIDHSAEYMIDEGFLNILNHNRLRALPNNYVLIEMSYLAESSMLLEAIYRLQSEGYVPVLAHPERYNYYHQDFNQYKLIKEMGGLLQLNVLAISGYYGSQVKLAASRLIKEGMYDFVGTDMHHERHLHLIKTLVDRYDIKALLKHNPIKNATAF